MTVTVQLSNPAPDSSSKCLLSDLSLAVRKSKKVVIVTGAGISCSCGIPDFRSSDGLYNLVKQQYPDVVLKGRDLFDASLFRDSTSTSVFYTFISELKRSIDEVSPSPTHHFIKKLDTKGKLLRSYTQNIDCLEERAGLLGSSSTDPKSSAKGKSKVRWKEIKTVQLHGDIRRVRCTICSADVPFTQEHADVFGEGRAPDCLECTARSDARIARSARPLKIGTLRPAIVLYDEPHPLGDVIGAIETADIARKPDLLIIMGTSLKVHGLKRLVKDFAKAVHSSNSNIKTTGAKAAGKSVTGKVIFVNKTPPSSEWDGIIDYHVAGETDAWVKRVLDDWHHHQPSDWETQTTLFADGDENSGHFKTIKTTNAATKSTKGTKKRRTKAAEGSENIPPSRPSPLVSKSQSAMSVITLSPPTSPSKRRQDTSHYSKIECSPSKKRPGDHNQSTHSVMPLEERGILFGRSKSTNMAVEIDLGICEMVKAAHSLDENKGRLASVKTSRLASTRKKNAAATTIPAEIPVIA